MDTLEITNATVMNSAPLAEPEIKESVSTDLQEELGNGWKVVIWDDDVHTIEYVAVVFMKHFGLSEEIAVKKTFEVHMTGSSVLDRGSKSGMEFHSLVMDLNYGLTATVEKDSDTE